MNLCTVRLYEVGDNLGNEMNFGMNYAPGAGLIARPADLQFMLPWCRKSNVVPRITPLQCYSASYDAISICPCLIKDKSSLLWHGLSTQLAI